MINEGVVVFSGVGSPAAPCGTSLHLKNHFRPYTNGLIHVKRLQTHFSRVSVLFRDSSRFRSGVPNRHFTIELTVSENAKHRRRHSERV